MMSTKIPYEDVQTAANQIAQCASNVLTVTIFPLMKIVHMTYVLGN
jgi:hypothetical protein